MKKFVLITHSESGDSYSYFIEHPQMPTSEEIEAFLWENACDIQEDEDGERQLYEYQEMLFEITEFQRIPGYKDKLQYAIKNFSNSQVDLDDDFTAALDELENENFNSTPKKVRFAPDYTYTMKFDNADILNE